MFTCASFKTFIHWSRVNRVREDSLGTWTLPDFAVTTPDHQIKYLWLEWSPPDFHSCALLSPCRWTMTTILCINTGRQAGNALPSGFSPTFRPQTSSCPRRRATGSDALAAPPPLHTPDRVCLFLLLGCVLYVSDLCGPSTSTVTNATSAPQRYKRTVQIQIFPPNTLYVGPVCVCPGWPGMEALLRVSQVC